MDELRPGRLLAELDATMMGKLAAKAAEPCLADYVISSMSTFSGPISACPKGDGALSGKLVESDTVTVSTIASRLNGLAMELGRTRLIGSPEKHIFDMYDAVEKAQDAAMEAAVAGRPVSGIHMAAQTVFDRAGYAQHFRLRSGHGVGVVIHDFPESLPFENRMLLEGEVYAIEPALFIRWYRLVPICRYDRHRRIIARTAYARATSETAIGGELTRTRR